MKLFKFIITILAFLIILCPGAINAETIEIKNLNQSIRRLKTIKLSMIIIRRIDEKLKSIAQKKQKKDVYYSLDLNKKLLVYLREERLLIYKIREYEERLNKFIEDINRFDRSILKEGAENIPSAPAAPSNLKVL